MGRTRSSIRRGKRSKPLSHTTSQLGRRFAFVWIFCLLFSALVMRAISLHLRQDQRLDRLASRQYQRQLRLPFDRGDILDRNDEILATSLSTQSVFANPAEVKNPDETVRQLSLVLGIDQGKLRRRLAKKANFVWIKRRPSPREEQSVRSLNLPGIHFVEEKRRFYPNVDLAGQLLGFVGYDSVGLEGLELSLDPILRFNPGKQTVSRDALGRMIYSDAGLQGIDEGHHVRLTIDEKTEHIVERELGNACTQYDAVSCSALVMDPNSGAVLAMANWPPFNPNTFGNADPAMRRNRLITDAYEPGSTFKSFLVASAIEEQILKPDDLIYCEYGSYRMGKGEIHDVKELGTITVAEVVQYSSNIGASKIAGHLGASTFLQYIEKFGFGQRYEIEMPGEVGGRVPSTPMSALSLANMSFGQGISVTGLQLAAAFSALVNGGLLVRPYVVDAILDQDHRVVERRKPTVLRRVISPETSRAVVQMLELVTGPNGSGFRAAVEGIRTAGKTGTAQKYDLIQKEYSSDRYVSSFIGVAPSQAPKFVVLVVLDEPRRAMYGGTTAAPVFSNVVRELVQLWQIPYEDTIAQAHPQRDGSIRPLVRHVALRSEERLTHLSWSRPMVMPDFSGWTMRRAVQAFSGKPFELAIEGTGIVIDQFPRPGSQLAKGTHCKLRFSPN